MLKILHIVPFKKEKWMVIANNAKRASRILNSKKEACTYALNRENISQVYIHKSNGSVESRIKIPIKEENK